MSFPIRKVDLALVISFSLIYIAGVLSIFAVNRCNISFPLTALLVLFVVLYSLLIAAILSPTRQLLFFETDMIDSVIVQLMVYRMATIYARLKDQREDARQ